MLISYQNDRPTWESIKCKRELKSARYNMLAQGFTKVTK